MPSTETTSAMTCVRGPLAAADTDLVIVPWFEEDTPDAMPGLDAASGGELARALLSKELTAKPFEFFITPLTDRSWRARRLALIGAGRSSEYDSSLVRKLSAAGGLAARSRHIQRVAFVLRGRI